MSEITRTHLNDEQSVEQINAVNAIKALTASINAQVEFIYGKTAKQAFLNSVENLNKKCEIYSREKLTTSPDEKRVMKEASVKALADFRAKNQKEIFTDGETNNATEIDESISEISENKMGTKKGRKH